MEWLSYTPLQPPLITMTCSKSYYFRQRIVLGALCLFVSSAGTAKTTSVHQVQSTNQTSDTNDASNTPLSGYLPAIIGGGFAIALIGFAAIAARYWGRPVEPAPGPAGDEGGRGSNHDAPRQQAPRPATVVAPLAPPAASLAGGASLQAIIPPPASPIFPPPTQIVIQQANTGFHESSSLIATSVGSLPTDSPSFLNPPPPAAPRKHRSSRTQRHTYSVAVPLSLPLAGDGEGDSPTRGSVSREGASYSASYSTSNSAQ